MTVYIPTADCVFVEISNELHFQSLSANLEVSNFQSRLFSFKKIHLNFEFENSFPVIAVVDMLLSKMNWSAATTVSLYVC